MLFKRIISAAASVCVFASSMLVPSYNGTAYADAAALADLISVSTKASSSPSVWDGEVDTSWFTENETEFSIKTAQELAGLALLVNTGTDFSGMTITLENDIFLNDISDADNWISAAPDNEWTPAGSLSYPFAGIFNGNGYTVHGLYISSSVKHAGLFGYLSGTAVISNLTVGEGLVCQMIDAAETYGYAGGAAGYAMEGALISSCVNNCTVSINGYNYYSADSNFFYAGGICGWSNASIVSCTNNGSIKAESDSADPPSKYVNKSALAGGICGLAFKGSITDCVNNGNINAANGSHTFAGGISGSNMTAVTGCVNKGTVKSYKFCAGGISGEARGNVTECTNLGTVSCGDPSSSYDASAGGICGRYENDNEAAHISQCSNYGSVSAFSTTDEYAKAGGIHGYATRMTPGISGILLIIDECYNRGSVSSSWYSGGILGYDASDTSLACCYNSGELSAEITGGIVGYRVSEDLISDCYYLNTASKGVGSLSNDTISAVSDSTMRGSGFAELLGEAFAYVGDEYPVLAWETAATTSSGTCGYNLSWQLDAEGTLTIFGDGAMYDWEDFSDVPWNENMASIKKVIIKDGVTYIGDRAFYDCSAMTSITLPDSLTAIGQSSFFNCCSLDSIILSDNVTKIGYGAFTYCSALFSVEIPEQVAIIDAYTFAYCDSLASISIMNPECEIYLAEYTISDTAVIYGYVGSTAEQYADTYGRTFVNLDEVVTSPLIASGTCGDNLTWELDSGYTLTISGEGEMYDWSTAADVPWCDYRSFIKNAVIKDGVTSIGGQAFYSCELLSSVTLPHSVAAIGSGAFRYCSSLTAIIIENTECEIDNSANTLYSDATIYGYNNSTAQLYAENYDRSFVSLGIANGLLGDNLSWMLDNDGKLTIIGNGDMTDLGPASLPPWYDYRDSVKSIVIEDGITSIGDFVFYGHSAVASVTIPDSVTDIGECAFAWCSDLSSVYIPEGVIGIGDTAFYYCGSLTLISLPVSVTSIGRDAFCECLALSQIIIENTECEIYDSASTISSTRSDETYPFNGTIYSYEGSTAQAYAEKYGRNYISFDAALIVASGTCGDSLEWKLDENAVLTISGTGAMTEWTSVTEVPWNKYRSSITEAVISDGVTDIGDYAFYNCTSLASVTVPDSVADIGQYAFSDCSALKSITIGNPECAIHPSTLTIPDSTIIYGCSSSTAEEYASTYSKTFVSLGITSRGTCGDNLTWELDDEGFLTISGEGEMYDWSTAAYVPWYDYKDSIVQLIIEEGVTNIGENAFRYCPSMTSAILPGSLTKIGNSAFYNCDCLYSLDIPYSVAGIGDYAFFDCDGLGSVTVPVNVASIGTDAFYDCGNIWSFTIENPDCEIADSSGTIPVTSTIYGYGGSTAEDYANNYGRIFVQLKALTASGTCGDNLTWELDDEGILTISGSGAMYDWSTSSEVPWYDYAGSINKVVIENGVTSIGEYAFYACNFLTSVTIPNSVTSVDYRAFGYCESLTSITIPDSVTSIGDFSFDHCDALASITIPDSVTSIGFAAFENCPAMTSIIIENPDCEIYNLDATISETATIYGHYGSTAQTYAEAHNRTFVSLSSVLGRGTCGDGLVWVLTDDGVLTISGTGDMYDWAGAENMPWAPYKDAIGTVIIEDGVTSIGTGAFNRCEALISISIPDSIASIGNSAFYYCSSLKEITIPGSVAAIEAETFYHCTGLETLVISEGVTNIGYSAFQYCGMESVTVPASVTAIGDNAFYECPNIKEITILNPNCEIARTGIYVHNSAEPLTVYGYSGSTAEAFVNNSTEMTFVSLDNPSTETTTVTTTITTTTTTTTTTMETTTTSTSTTTTTTTTTTSSETTSLTTAEGITEISLKVGETRYVPEFSQFEGVSIGNDGKVMFRITDSVLTAYYPGTAMIPNSNYRIIIAQPYAQCLSDKAELANVADSLQFTVHDFDKSIMDSETFADYFCVVSNPENGKHLSYFSVSYENGTLTVTLLERPSIVLDQYYIAFRHNTVLIELGKLTIGEETVALGDVDSDGSINAVDASMVLKEYAIAATGGTPSFTAKQSAAADVNKDGTADAVDASKILSYYAYTATGGKDSFGNFLNS